MRRLHVMWRLAWFALLLLREHACCRGATFAALSVEFGYGTPCVQAHGRNAPRCEASFSSAQQAGSAPADARVAAAHEQQNELLRPRRSALRARADEDVGRPRREARALRAGEPAAEEAQGLRGGRAAAVSHARWLQPSPISPNNPPAS